MRKKKKFQKRVLALLLAVSMVAGMAAGAIAYI